MTKDELLREADKLTRDFIDAKRKGDEFLALELRSKAEGLRRRALGDGPRIPLS